MESVVGATSATTIDTFFVVVRPAMSVATTGTVLVPSATLTLQLKFCPTSVATAPAQVKELTPDSTSTALPFSVTLVVPSGNTALDFGLYTLTAGPARSTFNVTTIVTLTPF